MNIDFADIVDGSGWPVAGLLTGFIVFALVKNWLAPWPRVLELLKNKDELLTLKDEQIGLLTEQRDRLQTTSDTQVAQISGLVDATSAFKHFFQEVPVVPSKGDTEKVET